MKKRSYHQSIIQRSAFRGWIFWSVLTVLVLTGVITLSIKMCSLGSNIKNLEIEENRLTQENILLREKLVQTTSLTNIKTLSQELGYRKVSQVVYLTPNDMVAKLP